MFNEVLFASIISVVIFVLHRVEFYKVHSPLVSQICFSELFFSLKKFLKNVRVETMSIYYKTKCVCFTILDLYKIIYPNIYSFTQTHNLKLETRSFISIGMIT